jgi:hypothetical protein
MVQLGEILGGAWILGHIVSLACLLSDLTLRRTRGMSEYENCHSGVWTKFGPIKDHVTLKPSWGLQIRWRHIGDREALETSSRIVVIVDRNCTHPSHRDIK